MYFAIPAIPEHHTAAAPLAHRNDGDAYILAVSFPTDEAEPQYWVRGRFVRTSPFYVESRQKKRIYRGSYGSSGAVGVNAPVKPKASSAKGISVWLPTPNQPVVMTFGLRSLPYTLGCDTLATKGLTALGKLMTGSAELMRERPGELCLPPIIHAQGIFTVGVSRTPVGKITAAFITELQSDYTIVKRYPAIPVPPSCEVVGLAVCDDYHVLAMHRVVEESGGFLSSVFGTGKQKQAPVVDTKYGTILTIVSRKSGKYTALQLPDVLLTRLVSVISDQSSLCVNAIELSSNDESDPIRLSTIANSHSGHLWHSQNDRKKINVQNVETKLTVSESGKAMTTSAKETTTCQLPAGIVIVDFVTSSIPPLSGSLSQSDVYIVFDQVKQRSGIAVRTDSSDVSMKMWFADTTKSILTGATLSPNREHMGVLMTNDEDLNMQAEVLIFSVDTIENGPVDKVALSKEQFGSIGASVGAVWADHAASWSVDGNKPAKSSYEIFNGRDWNDIDSGFSGLGL